MWAIQLLFQPDPIQHHNMRTYCIKVSEYDPAVHQIISGPHYGTCETNCVIDPILVFETQPRSNTSGDNADVSFSAYAIDESVHKLVPTYQWQQLIGATWTDIAGETGDTLVRTNLIISDDGNQYRVIASVLYNNQTYSIESNTVTLTVPSANLIVSGPVDTTSFISDASASFSVIAEETVYYNSTISYQWQYKYSTGAFAHNKILNNIDGEAAGDQSGWSVSLSADGMVLAVGARDNNGTGEFSGHVRVWERDNANAVWSQRGGDIDGEASGDQIGWSVSLSSDGNTLAAGARDNDGNGVISGHVRIYDWTGSVWSQRGGDIDGEAAGDESGYSVSMSADGQTVAIGAPYNDGNGLDSGHVRVYGWTGSAWIQRGADIDGESADDHSGFSISLSADGQTVAIGARANDGNGSNSGHVRVYDWTGSAWSQRGVDIDGEAAYDQSGRSVSMSADGQTVAIGAYLNDGNGTAESGHVRVWEWDNVNSAWVQKGGDIDGEAAGDQSGWSVSLSADGSILAVGAPYNDDNGSSSGHVRVFGYGPVLSQNFVDIQDENSNTLNLSDLTTANNGEQYRVIVTAVTPVETVTVISDVATLTVPSSNLFFQISPSDATSDSSASATFSALAVENVYNVTPTYQWQLSQNGGADWSNIENENSSTLSLTSLQTSDDGNQYRVVATADTIVETVSLTSSAATLEVPNNGIIFDTQPQNQTSDINAAASFTASATEVDYGSTVTYQWQSSLDGSNWSNIDGQNTNTLSLTGLELSDNETMYRVVATAVTPVATEVRNSNVAILSILQSDLSFGVYSTAVSSDANAEATLSATATETVYGATPTYQWQQLGTDGVTWNNLSETTDTLSLTGLDISDNGNKYRLVATASTIVGDFVITSSTITLTVPSGSFSFTTQPSNTSPDSNGQVTFTALAEETFYNTAPTYQWYYSSDNTSWNIIPNSNSPTLSFAAVFADNDKFYRATATVTNVVGQTFNATSSSAQLTIPTPVISFNISPTATMVSDLDGNATNSASATETTYNATVNYQWEVQKDGETSWSDVSGATFGLLSLTGLTVSDNDNDRYRVRAYVVLPLGTFSKHSSISTLDVPAISATYQSHNYSITSDALAEAQFTAPSIIESTYGVSPTSYQWQSYNTSTSQWEDMTEGTDVAGVTGTTLSLSSLTLSDSGNQYRIVSTFDYPIQSVDLISNAYTLTVPDHDITIGDIGNVTAYLGDAKFYPYLINGSNIVGNQSSLQSGHSVSLGSDGMTLAVGEPSYDSDRGRVMLLEWNGYSWFRKRNYIDGEAAGDSSGWSVSLSADGSILAVGAPNNDGNGNVRVWEWDNVNVAWLQKGGDIDGEAAGDKSGWSVSLSSDGSILAVGARFNDGSSINKGNVRVWEWDGSAWVQRGGDIDGEAAYDHSGYSVRLSGDGTMLAIGAPLNDDNGTHSGHVRVFEWSGSAWVQKGSDIDGEAAGDQSGSSVSLSSDGSILAVGAIFNDGGGTNHGHVRLWEWSGSAWIQQGSDFEDSVYSNQFGSSVSLSSNGDVLAVGEPLYSSLATHRGRTSTYTRSGIASSIYDNVTITYQWYESLDGGNTWSAMAGETSTTLSLTELTTADNGNKYKLEVTATSIVGSTSVYTNEATLTVDFTYNEGATYSTGAGHFGQLGHGDTSSLSLLEPISSTVSQLATDGQLYSAGSDAFGQLGVANPVAAATDGQPYSAGSDTYGQLGNG